MAVLTESDKIVTLDSLSPVLQAIKNDIEQASTSGGGSSSSEDIELIKARLTEVEKYVNDMNPWGKYIYKDEIWQPELSSYVYVEGTQFYQEYLDDEETFWDNMEAEKYKVYIPRNCDDAMGLNRYKTLLPWEGSQDTPGTELSRVCKYMDVPTWNWNFDGEKIVLNQSTDSEFVFVILKITN